MCERMRNGNEAAVERGSRSRGRKTSLRDEQPKGWGTTSFAPPPPAGGAKSPAIIAQDVVASLLLCLPSLVPGGGLIIQLLPW